jgi:hypothetical protein
MTFVLQKKVEQQVCPPLLLPLMDPGSEMDKNQDPGCLSRILVPSLTCLPLLSFDDVNCTVMFSLYGIFNDISMFCHSESITCGSS